MVSRRIATFLLGVWIGCCLLVDLLAMQTGNVSDRFVDNPGDQASALVAKAGKENLELVLHHVSLERTRALLSGWELAQLGIAVSIGILIVFSDQRKPLAIVMCTGMATIVAGQAFLITPQWTDLGRELDMAAAGSLPVVANRVWMLAHTYAGIEVVKLVIGGLLASYFFAMESIVRRSHRSRSKPRAEESLGNAPVRSSLN